MKLYLVRHGEALAKTRDPDQPLSARGVADVERLAGFLERRGLRAARVVHSGKTRARQTADILARALAPGGECAARDGLAPNDPVAAFAAEVAGWSDDVAVVGHLPFMARLATRLVGGGEGAAVVDYAPGAMACLERGDGGAWTIAWLLDPALLAGEGSR